MSQMCPNCSFDNPDDAQVCARCPAPLRNLLGEKSLLSERYEVTSVLGCGSMGAVYLANDTRLAGRRCAIKENRPDPAAPVNIQEQTREQFLAEASILARLDHPNLPKVSDYFIENVREYLVMDYVEGEDLESRMQRTRQPLDEASVLSWADQILDALNYLHQQKPQPIIHRDIKPANLRVDLYDRIKLVDFGLVKLLDANSPETKLELRGVGTPAYAPLEQFAGSEHHTDVRSDVYSLAATLYHLLTHLPPVEVHQRLLKPESLPPLRELNSSISPRMEAVILKAMAVYPNDRYQTANEMRQALAGVKSEPMVTVPLAAEAGAGKSSNSPIVAGVIGLVIVLLLLVSIYFLAFSDNDTEAQGIGDVPTQPPVATMADTTPEEPVINETPEEPPTNVAPLQSQPTRITDTPTRVVEDVAASAMESPVETVTGTPTPVPDTVTATPEPEPTATTVTPRAVSARGIPAASLVGTIAYPVFNGNSYDLYFGKVDGSGSTLFREDASQPAFSPNGSRIAFHSWRPDARGLINTTLSGDDEKLFAAFVEDQLPTWSSDGTEVMFLSRRQGDRKSRLVKVGSSQIRAEGQVLVEGEYPTIGPSGQFVFKGWGNTGTGLRSATTSLTNIQPITDNNFDTAPSISPDGQQVVFMSRRAGDWEIYSVNIDGSDLKRLTDNTADDGLPIWSPDGNVIAFVSNRAGEWAVWAMLPDGTGLRQLFETNGSPDGLVVPDLNVSRGWAEERISWTP